MLFQIRGYICKIQICKITARVEAELVELRHILQPMMDDQYRAGGMARERPMDLAAAKARRDQAKQERFMAYPLGPKVEEGRDAKGKDFIPMMSESTERKGA